MALRSGGQQRLMSGERGGIVTGWDMTAVLALGRAMGVCEAAMAEWLPSIEAAMVKHLNAGGGNG